MLKNLYLGVILVMNCSNLLSQTLSGIVNDENLRPLPGASVYLNGTTIGTTTDEKGSYEITFENRINSSLIIRFIGYQTVVIENPFDKPRQIVHMVPKTFELKEVVVHPEKYTSEQKLGIFREEFLGRTESGNSCKIKNEDDITLKYNYEVDELTASSIQPIIIENPFLGYLLYFNLIEFKLKFNKKSIKRKSVESFLIIGTTLYKDIGNSERSIEKRREEAYSGSSKHFFRNMYYNIWGVDDFILFKSSNYYLRNIPANPKDYFKISDTLGLKKILILQNDRISDEKRIKNKSIPFSCAFMVYYNNIEQSSLTFRSEVFYLDKFGNYQPHDLIDLYGKMSDKRVGDQLPMDYIPNM
jgi:hypothetical protein